MTVRRCGIACERRLAGRLRRPMHTNERHDNKASDAADAQSIDRERIERLADSDLPCAWVADLLLDVIDDVDADDNGGGPRR